MLKNTTATAKTEVQYWQAMSKGSTAPIVLAVVVALALYALERNIAVIADLGLIQNTFIGRYLSRGLDQNTYVQLLTAIASVTGVFLGLYFTAVSTVISNTYSSVSGNVRELLLKDKIGNNYVKLVSFLTALSVILLSVSVAGVAPLHIAVPLLAVVSCLAIFAFVNLGKRAFFLSDPTLFFNTLSSELLKWVRQATHRGHHWRNSNFQEHYRRQALKSVTTVATLAEISSEKPELQGQAHPELLRKMLLLVNVYQEEKLSIPSTSNWFSKKAQHKQWYLTESTELESATQTYTSLKPNEMPDTTWLEDAMLDVIFKANKADLEQGNYQALYNKILSLDDFFKETSNKWLSESGIEWQTKLSKDIVSQLASDAEIDEQQEQYSLAVADIVASLPMSLELGFAKAVGELNADKLRTDLLNTNWLKNSSPYGFKLPPNTIKTLEKMHEGFVFEKLANASHRTQNWYVTELILHDLDMALYGQWQALISMLETWYKDAGVALSKAKKYKHSAIIYSRAIEQAWKLDSHIETLKELSKKLGEDSKINFEKNAEWNWEKEHDRVTKFRDMAIEGQSKLIPKLWNTEKPDPEMPDLFGGAVHFTGEACYRSLEAGDAEKFKALFRTYFFGIIGIFDSVRPQVLDWEQASAISWMSEPILDLFDISGYAYVFAEYHDMPEIWNECKTVWDTYIEELPAQLPIYATISKYHQTPRMMITPRATLRSRWQIALGKLLSDLHKQTNSSGYYSQPRVEHSSELIRNIAPLSDSVPSMFVDAIDIFTVKYLITLQASNELDFGMIEDKISNINGSEEVDNE